MSVIPPSDFPSRTTFAVTKNSTISSVASDLKTGGYIASARVFNLLVHIINPKYGVISGTYYFDRPANALSVAYRISKGKYELDEVILTIPEGSNVFQIATIINKSLPEISIKGFTEKAQALEGYLFPDTYHFLPTAKAEEIIQVMRDNFDRKIIPLEKNIGSFGKPLIEVIKMASYLEEEARQTETRKMIAGILWKRIEIGMPLQIDAAFQYVNGKNTYELSLDDLKTDSAYNTYKYRGFTPTAISNPGLDSIEAAFSPTKSDYLYFLTDDEGIMHYAKTLDEHNLNKSKYLR